jgi:hypothetical protein
MIFGIITLLTAIIISLSAAVYSILGLTAIFSAAYWPIVILGGSLEFGKIITTLWLHKYWVQAEIQYKLYLSFAVVVLMAMTSIGVFGFLSKAHSDQGVPTGDISAQIELIDTKLITQRENINAARKVLTQMDGAVDEVLARSKNEQGARNANTLRQQQTKDRSKLATDISTAQIEIAKLNEQKALVAKDLRKVEAEVGPIKYIAALIYGDNPDGNLLEKAVRWVIILIVSVFDPLAITLLLAGTKAFDWEREKRKKLDDSKIDEVGYDKLIKNLTDNNNRLQQENAELTSNLNNIAETAAPAVDQKATYTTLNKKLKEFYSDHGEIVFETQDPDTANGSTVTTLPAYEPDDNPLTNDQIEQIKELAKNERSSDVLIASTSLVEEDQPAELAQDPIDPGTEEDIDPYGNDVQRHAMAVWRSTNPDKTFGEYILKYNMGEIAELPWEQTDHVNSLNLSDRDLLNLKLKLEADNDVTPGEMRGFGIRFPSTANKGDMFLRVDVFPGVLYKFNGFTWVKINKNLSDSYLYDDAYIEHLINKIDTGEYDPDLLSDVERDHIAQKLKS